MMMPILNIWRGRKSPNGGRRSKVSGCHHRSLKRVDARRGASRNPVPIRVQVALNVDAGAAVDWATGQTVHAGPLHKGDTLTVTVAPGNTTFLEFAPAMGT